MLIKENRNDSCHAMLVTPVTIFKLKLSKIDTMILVWETAWQLLVLIAWVGLLMQLVDERTMSNQAHPQLVVAYHAGACLKLGRAS